MSGIEQALAAVNGVLLLVGVPWLAYVLAKRDRGKPRAWGMPAWAGVLFGAWLLGTAIAVLIGVLIARSGSGDAQTGAVVIGVLAVGLPVGLYAISAALFSVGGYADDGVEPERNGRGSEPAATTGLDNRHSDPAPFASATTDSIEEERTVEVGSDQVFVDPDPFTPPPLEPAYRHQRLEEIATEISAALPRLSDTDRALAKREWETLRKAETLDAFEAQAVQVRRALG